MRDNKVSDKILQRIKKLMALGLGDPDSPEAKSAMDKVAELMQEHGVAEIDLEDNGHIKTSSLIEEIVECYSKSTDKWERVLGTQIAKAFDCKMLTLNSGKYFPNSRTFLGAKSDVKLSIYFYKFIRMQIMRGAESQFDLIRDQKSYGFGCVSKVVERLKDMYAKREEVMTEESQALIVVKKDDVVNFYKEKYPHTTKGGSYKITGSADAYSKGQADGNKIQMSRQVGNKSATGAVMIGGK